MAKKRITIEEIAMAASVSKTTVSRYLNGRTDLMSEATAAKIQNIIELCDYHPSEYARALKNNKTRMIGIIIANILSPWSSAFIGGCEKELSRHGYTALFFNSDNSIEKEKEMVASLDSRGVEGLIVNPVSYSDPYLMNYSLHGVPVVICDCLIKGYPFSAVLAEVREPVRRLIAHLKSQGFTRPIMFTLKKRENYARIMRVQAFRDAMVSEYGYCHEEDIITLEDDDPDEISNILQKLIASASAEDHITVFCVNTSITLRVFSSIQRMKLSIPGDIGVCGQDDWCWDKSICLPTLIYPEVTTINVDSLEIGRQCAKMILRKIAAGNSLSDGSSVVEVPCSFSQRASTTRNQADEGGTKNGD